MQINDHWTYPDKTPQMTQPLNTLVWNETEWFQTYTEINRKKF